MPPLERVLIDLPLSGGLSQQIDERVMPPGALPELVNGRFDQAGAIVHRDGYGLLANNILPLTTPALMSAPTHVHTSNSELVATAPDTLGHSTVYSYTEPYWAERSHHVQAGVSRVRGAHPEDNVGRSAQFCLAVGRFTVLVWAASDTDGINYRVWIRVLRTSTGAVVDERALGFFDYAPMVAVDAAGIVAVIGRQPVTKSLIAYLYSTVTLAPLPTQVIALANGAGGWLFDAHQFSTTEFVVTFFEPGVIPHTLTTWTVAPNPWAVVGSDVVVLGVDLDIVCIVASESSGEVRVGTLTTAGAVFVRATQTVALLFEWTQVVFLPGFGRPERLVVGLDGGNRTYVVFSHLDAVFTPNDPRALSMQRLTAAGALDGGVARRWHAMIVGRPFPYGGNLYMWIEAGDPEFGIAGLGPHVLVSLYPGTLSLSEALSWEVEAVSCVGDAFVLGTILIQAPSTITRALRTALPTATKAQLIPPLDVAQLGGFDVTTVDFAPSLRGGDLGDDRIAQGGFASSYDGVVVVEEGFTTQPTIIRSALIVGPGNVDPGTYQYSAIYEWIDAQGRVHRSSPSLPREVVVAAPLTQVDLVIDNLMWTRRGIHRVQDQDVVIRLYRTEAGPGKVYKEVARASQSADGGLSHPSVSIITRPRSVLSDGTNDTSLQANAALYTEGGVQPNEMPPPALDLLIAKRRAWMISADDPRAIWYTKELVDAQHPGWSTALQTYASEAEDDPVALATLDAAVLLFTPSSVHVLDGDGPGDTAQGGSFTSFQKISSVVGCTDARSVVSTSKGAWFWAGNGIWLIDRSRQAQFVGAPIQKLARQYRSCIAAHVSDADDRVYFLLQDAVDLARANAIVVYDEAHDCWSEYQIADDARILSPSDHTGWRDLHAIATGNGVQLQRASATPGLDNGFWPPLSVRSPWMRVSALNGFMRAWNVITLCRARSSHRLWIDVFTNYNELAPVETHGPFTVASGALERLRAHIGSPWQRCSAISLRLSDGPPVGAPPSVTPIGFDLAGLTLEIGRKPTRAAIAATRKG